MQLGRYEILRQLATGGVADVLLARASGLEGFARHVVIKRIRPELAHEDRLVESFLEEARIAGSLHHQNIVQVHDIGEHEGTVFFAMEYVHGEDARKLIAHVRTRGDHVPLAQAIAIVTSTAAGLHHAHEQKNPAGERLGIVHRDVAPSNILLGFDGSVKIVDFGLAKAGLRSPKTASGTLKGKASYMSPEQCVGQPIDRRSDIFSLGIVLYEIVTSRRLFKAPTEYMTMAAVVEGAIPLPSSIRPDVPPALDAIIMRALERRPETRYQTADDLRAALEAFAIQYELRASSKALADYITAVFGQRPEPWHDTDPPRMPTTELDGTDGYGMAAAPPDNAAMMARLSPRTTSPIMAAHSMQTNVSHAWADLDDEEEEAPTRVLDDAIAIATAATPAPEMPGPNPEDGATIIAPPSFEDIEPDVVRLRVDYRQVVRVPTGRHPVGAFAPPPEPEPPAPPPPPKAVRAWRWLVAATTTYRREVIAATGGLIVVVVFGIAIQSCGHKHHGTPPPPDAQPEMPSDASVGPPATPAPPGGLSPPRRPGAR